MEMMAKEKTEKMSLPHEVIVVNSFAAIPRYFVIIFYGPVILLAVYKPYPPLYVRLNKAQCAFLATNWELFLRRFCKAQ